MEMDNEWKYQPVSDLDRSLAERMRGFPREPDMMMYGLRSLAAIGLRTWLKLYHRFKVIGWENLPAHGSFILVSNHSSHLDALVLMSLLPLRQRHRVFPVAAKDYFFSDLPRSFFAAIFINALPFSRLAHQRESLALCTAALKNDGNVLILFPEGTRSPSGEMGSFKAGIGMLAAGTDIPIIPCYIQGAFHAWPKGNIFPRPWSVRVMIGSARRYTDRPAGKESAELIASDLKDAVVETSKLGSK